MVALKMKKIFIFGFVFLILLSSVQAVDLTSATIYWSLDNSDLLHGDDPADASGNGYSGVNTDGATTGATGIYYEAFTDFKKNGAGISIKNATINTNMFDSGQETINVWVKLNSVNNGDVIFYHGPGGSNGIALDFVSGNYRLSSQCTGSSYGTTTGGAVTLGSWEMITIITDLTEDKILFYRNGTNTFNRSISGASDCSQAVHDFGLGFRDTYDDSHLNGTIDEFGYWEGKLTPTQINDLLTKFNPYNPATPPTSINSSLTVTVKDLYDASALSNFTVTLYNATHSWTNYTAGSSAIIFLPNNQTKTYTINVAKTGYFNYSTSLSVGVAETYQAPLYQAIVYFNASEIRSGNKITSFNYTETYQNNVSNISGYAYGYFRAGTYTINGTSSGYLPMTKDITVTALQNKTETLEFGTAKLNIFAKEIFTNNTIEIFNITLEDITYYSANDTKSSSDNVTIYEVVNGTFKLHIDAPDYAIEDHTIVIGNLTEYNYTFYLYSDNSITIRTYYSENSTQIIGKTVDYEVTYLVTNTTTYYSSTNGSIYLDNQTAGNYKVRVESDGFVPSEYFYTLLARNHIFLDTYLTSVEDLKYFYVRNLGNTLIEGALITVTQNINSSWVTIAQRYTDITGSAYFGLDDFTEYRILITAPTYQTKSISLTPVLDSYTIYLTLNSSISFETAYDDLSYSILPSGTVLNNLYNNFSFNLTTSSPSGLIEYFGLSATYNGTPYVDNVTGSVSGGTAVIQLPLFNASGTLDVNFWIKIENEDILYFTIPYYLNDITAGNYSLTEVADDYKNEFSDIEKVLIATGSSIFLMIVCFALGFPPASLGFIGTLPYVVFSAIEFLDWWITIITVVFALTLYFFMKD